MVQVRDVPDEVHAVLVQRAERRGMSLSAFLREVLAKEARTATLDEVLSSIGGIAPHISAEEIVDAIHAEREEREKRWS